MGGLLNYANEPTWVYRLYCQSGHLLYVGISRNVRERIETHARQQPWGALIDHFTLERFADRETAQEAERIAIEDEDPIHNAVRSRPSSRDSHAIGHVTPPAMSRGCHATNTPPHLSKSLGAVACGVSGSNRIRNNGYLPLGFFGFGDES